MSLFLLVAACATAMGGTIYVDDDVVADFNSIQAAINASIDGDIIVVGPGTYIENVCVGRGIDVYFLGNSAVIGQLETEAGGRMRSDGGLTIISGDGSVINHGEISAAKIYLIGKQIVNSGTIDASADAGGSITIDGGQVTLTADSVIHADATGTGTGGEVLIYADNLDLDGIVTAAGIDGYILFDPDVLDIDQFAADAIEGSLTTTVTVDVTAKVTINLNGEIDSSTQTNDHTLNFKDDNANSDLTINLNNKITLGVNQTLTGEGTEINVASSGLIQNGIDVAAAGATITVSDGTYTGAGNKNLDFNGKAITVKSQNGPVNCIINCGSSGRGFFFHTGETTDSVVEGFTIQNGNVDYGGGVYCSSSSPTITNCAIRNNWAHYGGGIYCSSSSPTITNCTISNNHGTTYYNLSGMGGGMWCQYNSDPTITNCAITNNSVDHLGGGVRCYMNCDPNMTNCTIANNWSGYGEGGVSGDYGTLIINNSILWGNDAYRQGGQIHHASATVKYSCVQGGYTGTGNIADNPAFADSGGGDYHLKAGSPCIDAGDNTAVPGSVTTDLDGNPRFVDDPSTTDTGNGTPPIVDMGAYECTSPIIFVDADATGGANNGTGWSDAYLYLQDALAVAVFGDYIFVAEGTYKPDASTANPGSGDRTATFQLINGVGLYGGYAGYGGANPNERNWRTNETILSGDLNGNDVPVNDPCDLVNEPTRGENSYQVVTGSGTDATAVLDGFIITAGNANEPYPSPNGRGGGMYNYSGSPTVVNCTFSRNSAVDVGGGMSNYNNSGPTVTNCTFSGNSALDGGGMDNSESGDPTVTNCTFIGNSAEDGGGMCNYSSSPTLTNCTFTGNSAISPDVHVLGGGGMCNVEYSSPTVTNCILWGNSSPEPNGPQIALKDNSTVSISYCDLQGGQTAIYKVGTNLVIWGEGNIDEDPVFIGSNGLDGIPGTADDEEDNVHLRNISPCINVGDPSGDYSGQVDLDGQPRVAYGRVDMGVDEVFPIAGDFEPDGDVDLADFAIFANHWLLGVE